ncbi:MAG: AMP-binding protein [Steroidobacteraceae bacterium]
MSSVWVQAPRPGAVARARVASRAHIEEIERVAFPELLPAWTILGALEVSAAASPNKAAILALDRDDPTQVVQRLTYTELVGLVRATAKRLHEVSGDGRPVISILTPLVPEAFIAAWAGAAAGIANPTNPFLRTDQVAGIMNAAGTTVLLCGGGAWEHLAELRVRVPTLRAVWVIGEAASADSFQRQIAAAGDDRVKLQTPREETDTTALFHTGGTTAAPKLVRHTQRGQLLNAWCCGAWSNSSADAIVAVGMPYFHVGGAMCGALRAMVFGQTLVLVGPEGYRSPHVIDAYWNLVEAHGVTNSISTPTTAAALVAAWNGQRAPPGYAHSAGGSAVPVRVAREFEEKFGTPLHEIWGMTELQGALIGNPEAAVSHLGSIGLAFPYHSLRCIEVEARDADRELARNSAGLLAVNGPCVTPGYLEAGRSHELFFRTSATQRWLNTGDLGRIDAQGYVWLQGRAKDLIIRGGHNIDPLVIEAALIAHPAVLHAAAVGEPDADKGELPVAYVQLRPGESASESELLIHCRREISERAAIPRAVRVIDVMPLTAVGKIFKPQLRHDATTRCVRAVMTRLGCCERVDVEVRESGGGFCVVLNSADPQQAELVEQIRSALERYTFKVEIETALCR